MEVIAKLGSLLGLSFIAGINLYATVAVTGICVKYQLVQGLPPELHVLANDAVIFLAVFLYVIEFLMDKVPGLDTLWDSLHTIIRPLGGAMLALMQVGEASPAMEVMVFMLGASLASVAHITKAGTRVIVNASPEPVSNFVVSTGEDVLAVGYTYLSLAYPKVTFFLTLLCLAIFVMVFPLIFRTVRMLLGAILFRIKCFLRKEAAWMESRSLPFQYDRFYEQHKQPGEKVCWTGRAHSLKVPGMAKFSPLRVVISSQAIHLLHRRRFRLQDKVLPLDELTQHKSYPGSLLAKWLLRTASGDWLLQLYQPLATTLPADLTPKDKPDEKLF
ncbi:DUF4126 domain-containing protein [Desulfoferrobacter suflitae]|uniref:DUF4126 domain-containing protein n=1 Tax=Desulfoferrobacter suflitae TaxID=2865782 RepID=UPI0021645D80|nr:DUF4126 domain-containing protein [Desulfoferrobacter suflitae]MCK8600613.1 DUF4126 domain-containing protein [Desulfoferrobacter suflitae]